MSLRNLFYKYNTAPAAVCQMFIQKRYVGIEILGNLCYNPSVELCHRHSNGGSSMKRIISAVLLSALLITSAVSCGSKDAADRTNISSTSSDCEKYAEWLQNRIGDFDGKVLVCDAERTADYGIDLAMFRSEGYVIKNVGDQTVIAAKSDDGFDRAVRYFANNTENCSNVVYGENERIGQLLIAGTDISEYRIVMPQSYPDGSYKDTAESAADILNFYILDACGFDLEITDKPGQHNIQLIIDDGTKYGDEGVGYEVKNGDLIITGGLKRGLIYAAYDFLENALGFRFLSRGVTYTYDAETISLDEATSYEKTDIPFAWRDTFTYIDGKTGLYPASAYGREYAENRIARKLNALWGQEWIQSADYGYGYGPDSNHSAYRLNPSVPDLQAPCYSDPDIYDECIENLRNYIDSLIASGLTPGVNFPQISISQNDGDGWCTCRDCMKTIAKYGSKSATLIDFINRISAELTPEYPGIEFWTLAYQPTEEAPKSMQIADNLYIGFCYYLACNNHSVDGTECPPQTGGYKNFDHIGNLENWLKLTDNVHVWYYANNFAETIAPVPIIGQMRRDLRYFAELGVKGMFIQNEDTTLGFDDLTSYLFAHLLWDPYMSEDEYDAAIREFLTLFYGEAAADGLYDYIMMLEAAGDSTNNCWTALASPPFDIYDYDYIAENFDWSCKVFEEAIAKAEYAEMERRLEMLSCHMYFNGISATFTDRYKNGTPEEKAETERRYQLLFDRMTKYKDSIMLAIFKDDQIPETLDTTVSPLHWYKPTSWWGTDWDK